MAATEVARVVDQRINREPNRSIVRGDDRSRTRADDDVDRNAAVDEPSQDAEVSGTAQASAAQHESNSN
jgi:hypothetical protein